MARKRQIDPNIWVSEQFNSLQEPQARLLYIGMISNADDEGRLKASPQYLKTIVFPADSCTIPEVLRWRSLISTVGLINLYVIDNVEYLCLPTWGKYQYISKPYKSKLPPPPDITNFRNHSKNIPALQHRDDNDNGIDNGIGIEDDNDKNGNGTSLSSSETLNIYSLYEQEIDKLTPHITEQLKYAENEYSSEWVALAIKIAVDLNHKNWKYINGILKKCKLENHPPTRTNGKKPTATTDPNYYKKGKYGKVVQS